MYFKLAVTLLCLLLLVGCDRGGSSGGNTPEAGSNWDEMEWDRGEWQ
ncbi:hypothetical protein [Alkalilimnicola ehrlichii]|nr:hypothetical protein [Alkalilimnicola ehrlichii]